MNFGLVNMVRPVKLNVAAVLAALALSGCVNHYCGPAYPNSTDPYCSIPWRLQNTFGVLGPEVRVPTGVRVTAAA